MRLAADLGLLQESMPDHRVTAEVLLGNPARARALLAQAQPNPLPLWALYQRMSAALLTWHSGQTATPPSPAPPGAPPDSFSRCWASIVQAVEAWPDDPSRAASLGEQAVRHGAELGLAQEDLPLVLGLALDLALAAGDLDAVRRLAELFAPLPRGHRSRLVAAHLVRAQAHLSADAAPGLRAAADQLEEMGVVLWAAAVRLEQAEALAAAGDGDGAARVLDAAEGALRATGAAPRLLDRAGALRRTTLLAAGA